MVILFLESPAVFYENDVSYFFNITEEGSDYTLKIQEYEDSSMSSWYDNSYSADPYLTIDYKCNNDSPENYSVSIRLHKDESFLGIFKL